MGQSKTSLKSSLKKQREIEREAAKDYAIARFNPSTGYEWRARRDRKKSKRSQTPGSTKNIKPTTLEKHFAKSSRAYKHKDYGSWLAKTSTIK